MSQLMAVKIEETRQVRDFRRLFMRAAKDGRRGRPIWKRQSGNGSRSHP